MEHLHKSDTVKRPRTCKGICIIRFAGLHSGEPCIKLISSWGRGRGGWGKFYVTSIKSCKFNSLLRHLQLWIQGWDPGGFAPPLFLDQNETQRAWKKFFWDWAPLFSGSGWLPPLIWRSVSTTDLYKTDALQTRTPELVPAFLYSFLVDSL